MLSKRGNFIAKEGILDLNFSARAKNLKYNDLLCVTQSYVENRQMLLS